MAGNKTTNGIVVSRVNNVLDQNLAPFSRKFSELIPEKSLTNVHPLVKSLLTGKIPNLQLAGRLAHFSNNWEKLTQDQEILSAVKGCVIPFFKVPVQRTKTGDNVQNRGIVNRSGNYGNAGQKSQKKVEHQFPNQFMSNILLVKMKDWGNRPCINLKPLNKFNSKQAFQNGRFALLEIPSQ